MYYGRGYSRGGGGCGGRLIFAVIIAAVSLFSYFSSRQNNPVTGETQYIDVTPEQEIALGVQAAPEMEQQYGGEDPDQNAQAVVDQVGNSSFLELHQPEASIAVAQDEEPAGRRQSSDR